MLGISGEASCLGHNHFAVNGKAGGSLLSKQESAVSLALGLSIHLTPIASFFFSVLWFELRAFTLSHSTIPFL
jgi:hypothetical protein